MVLGELTDPGLDAIIDMYLLAAGPGRERSLDEYDALLAAAGLRRNALLTTTLHNASSKPSSREPIMAVPVPVLTGLLLPPNEFRSIEV